ncbi:hypothetical protein ACHAXT_007834 [Thalassiosira profunda]
MSSSPYQAPASLLGEHLRSGRGLKSLAFDALGGKKKGGSVPNKATYATVCKTLQHLPAIDHILDANGKKLRKAVGFDGVRNKGLMYIMLYELLFGKYKRIRGGGKLKRMIVKHEKELRRGAEGYVKTHGAIDDGGGVGVAFPRYVRVNTLRASVEEVVASLRERLATASDGSAAKAAKGSQSASIYADAHAPNLLVMTPSSSLWLHRGHSLVESGKVVLQDKSSCFSALAVVHGLDDEAMAAEKVDYIDACAAPGNKTSHLAALASLLNGTNQPAKKKKGKARRARSTIHAFERNSTRFSTLSERMDQLVPSEGNVTVAPVHGDFLKSDPADAQFANVKAIMLDPSCSGSGIVNSPDRLSGDAKDGKDRKDDKRIESLSNFQLVALKHALSFPQAERVVYSTCSVHAEENEGVVSKALAEVNVIDGENEWQLAAPKCLERWVRRGKETAGLTKEQAECLVRCDGLDGDETNGFFVALFVRKRIADRINGDKKRAEADEPSLMADLPVYDGQFASVANEACEPKNTAEDAVGAQPTKDQAHSHSGGNQHNESKQDAKPSGKATDKSAKKRQKKLAWKKRQALQKAERMKKKEEASKAPSD